MKGQYKIINELKLKSGFVWDDVYGMGVTEKSDASKHSAWQALVTVHDHIYSLSARFKHY